MKKIKEQVLRAELDKLESKVNALAPKGAGRFLIIDTGLGDKGNRISAPRLGWFNKHNPLEQTPKDAELYNRAVALVNEFKYTGYFITVEPASVCEILDVILD